MANPLYPFGAGTAWVTQQTDSQGNTVTNPTPILIAGIQDISIDGSADVKELYGSNSFALAVARGKQKLAIKIKNAQLHGRLWNAIYFGQTLSAAMYEQVFDTTGIAIPTTPFTVTVSATAADTTHVQIPNSGTYGYNLGVRDSNNLPYDRVASAPTTGQYSLTGGVYTFAAADVAKTVFIDYNYTATSTVARKLVAQNTLMGLVPYFQLDIKIPSPLGGALNVTFPNCCATKFGIATKLDDFMVPEFDISAFAPGQSSPFTMEWSQ
jgi:hypothetical protein